MWWKNATGLFSYLHWRTRGLIQETMLQKPSKVVNNFVSSLTCVHLIHTVEEVVWSARDAVAAHTQAAVCALIPGVIGPAENTKKNKK